MIDLLKTFLEMSALAAVMICIVWAVRAVFSKMMNPAVLLGMWLIVLLRLCVPAVIESPVHIPWPEQSVSAVQEPEMAAVLSVQYDAGAQNDIGSRQPAFTGTDAGEGEHVPAGQSEPFLAERVGSIMQGISLWDALVACWIAGAAWVMMRILGKVIVFRRRLRGGEIVEGAVSDTVSLYKETLGIRKNIRVMECDCVDTPAVFGYFRPYLILPPGFAGYIEGERMAHIVLHELCHIKRGDTLKGYLWLIAKALHWFNPLVWAAYNMYREDVELGCDQMVVRRLGNGGRYAYSQTLIDVIRTTKTKNPLVIAATFGENQSKLGERVVRMINPAKRSKTAIAVSLLVALTMLVACFTTACRPKTDDGALTIDPSEGYAQDTPHMEASPGDAVSDAYRPAWADIDPEDMPYQYANMFKSAYGAFVWDTPDRLLLAGGSTLRAYDKGTGRVEAVDTPYHIDLMDDAAIAILSGNMEDEELLSKLSPAQYVSRLTDGVYYIVGHSLLRFKDGAEEAEVLIDEFDAIKPVIVDSYLYAVTETDIVRVDLAGPEHTLEKVVSGIAYGYSTDGRYLYYAVKDGEPALYRCNLDGKNPELVLEQLVSPTYLSFDDTYMYYCTFDHDRPREPTNGNIYRFPMDLSGEPELLCETGLRFPVVYALPTSPDTLLVSVVHDGALQYFFLPKEGGKLTALTIS